VQKNNANIFKAIVLYPDGIRSHDPQLQSSQWQAETLPLRYLGKFSEGSFLKGLGANWANPYVV
jgi:hypothetical protein